MWRAYVKVVFVSTGSPEITRFSRLCPVVRLGQKLHGVTGWVLTLSHKCTNLFELGHWLSKVKREMIISIPEYRITEWVVLHVVKEKDSSVIRIYE